MDDADVVNSRDVSNGEWIGGKKKGTAWKKRRRPTDGSNDTLVHESREKDDFNWKDNLDGPAGKSLTAAP